MNKSIKLTRGAIAWPGSSLAFKTGTWRVQRPEYQHRSAPCHTACPAGEDAQAYLALVAEEEYRKAWEVLTAVNPLPAITGRVCHHPCETSCNRRHLDAAIAIHNVERYLGDMALREGWTYPVGPLSSDGAPVAVVGAGPAGCSAAYHLARLGYRTHLFEALSEAGGLLRSAIPPYRLPARILDEEIARLLECAISFHPGRRLGRDFSLQDLQADYKAIFLAPGTQRSREWSIDGVTPRDLRVGLDLLKQWMDVGSIPTWESVAIVGAGNTAIDLARILKRAAVPEVHVISHKAIPGPGVPPEDAMPAIDREIYQGLEEGVILHEHRGVQRLILRGEQVVGVEMVHMKKLPDASGRMKRVAFEGTESLLHVEQVIPAIGQIVEPEGMESLLDYANFFSVDEMGRFAKHPGFFTGGDARGDRGTVSEAIGDGRRGALAIHAWMAGNDEVAESKGDPIGFEQINLNYFEPGRRPEEPMLPVEARGGFEEVELGLDKTPVINEGRRCFSCGSCLVCDNCWTLCPDTAVLRTEETLDNGAHYRFDYDYCKGCGLCAHECPTGFILMHTEV